MFSQESREIMKILNSSWYSSDEEWLERFNTDFEFRNAFASYAMNWEAIGTLLKTGMLNIEILALFISTNTLNEWERYRNIIHNLRLQNKRVYDMWEYTYDTLIAYLEDHPELKPGQPAVPPIKPSTLP